MISLCLKGWWQDEKFRGYKGHDRGEYLFTDAGLCAAHTSQ